MSAMRSPARYEEKTASYVDDDNFAKSFGLAIKKYELNQATPTLQPQVAAINTLSGRP